MKRSPDLLLALLVLAGCSIPPHKAAMQAPAVAGPDTAVAVPKGDSAGTILLRLEKLDSTRLPSDYASDLYLLALENFLAVAPDDERAPEIIFWKAGHLYNRGRFAEAAEAYSALRESFPQSGFYKEAGEMMAQAYMQLGRSRDAEEVLRGMLSRQGASDPEARKRVAQAIYLGAQRLERDSLLEGASQEYARLAGEFPEVDLAPAALYNAGVLQEKRGDWRQAIAIYERFFESFYASELLPKVLFREAKCRERAGDWLVAAEHYLNLARAHPSSPEAEPSLYNAGFAWMNGGEKVRAAEAFGAYAQRYPDRAEAPGMLFRAAETHMELRNWSKVEDLQSIFVKRYGGDPQRLIQALVMGGVAAYHQGKLAEAESRMKDAIVRFFRLGTLDAGSRYYAAQAQFTLAEIRARAVREATIAAGDYEPGLRRKTALLREAVSAYSSVFNFKIADWALRAGLGLGELFEVFGRQVYAVPRPPAGEVALEREVDALAALAAGLEKAREQYRQMLALARQQDLHNRWVERARARLDSLPEAFRGLYAQSRGSVYRLLPASRGEMEKVIAVGLERAEYLGALHAQALRFLRALSQGQPPDQIGDTTAESGAGGPSEARMGSHDSLASDILMGSLKLGQLYLAAADLARGAAIPPGYSPTERFFYKVKLVQEGIPQLEAKGMERFAEGLALSRRLGLRLPLADTLGQELGRTMYVQARCFDLLARQALLAPPIPRGAGEEEKRAFIERFDEQGYTLQDEAVRRYRSLVEKVEGGLVPAGWGELALLRLFEVEPDKWSRVENESRIAVRPWNGKGLAQGELEALRAREREIHIPNFEDAVPGKKDSASADAVPPAEAGSAGTPAAPQPIEAGSGGATGAPQPVKAGGGGGQEG